MLINSASRQLADCIVTSELLDNILIIILNYVYLETMWETDTTVAIYSWRYRERHCPDHGLKNNTRLTRFCDPTKKKSLQWRHCQSDIGGPSVLGLTISRNAFVLRCIWLK